MKLNFNKVAIALAASVMSAGAFAGGGDGSPSATMGVTATISPECSVGNTTTLAFGILSMLSNGAQSTAISESSGGTFDAICTSGTSTPQLKFTSLNTSGSDFRLVGTDTTTYIVYTLKEGSGGTAIAHDTAASFTGFTADGTTKSLAVKGTISASEKHEKAQQGYTDTITITSSYSL